MYPIASELLQKTVEQTASVGVPPVHIGDPTDIGILDLQASYSGSTTLLNNGDIPVFWPSLMTIQEAVQRAGPALAYVGSTASDFSLAMPVNESSHKIHLSMLHKEGQPFCASVVSQSSVKAVNNLEDCLITGSWRKGVKELQSFTRGNLLQAAVSLSHSKHVAVTTGFPCLTHLSPPDETDGPPGILAIVRSLIACGKQVTVIVDHKNSFLRQTIEEALKKFVPHSQDVIVVPYPPSSVDECDTDTARKFLFDQSTGKATFDHLVALERTGPNYEGRYMTMTAKDISRLCDPVDQLFTLSSQEIIKTVAVGDGGNEVGFGKLRSEVGQFVDLGDQIACVVPADHLIVSGVSNWGGYALAAALCCLRRCPLHAPYVNRGIGGKDVQTSEFMPSANEERDLLAFLMKAGMRDGILPDQMMSVDGKSFDDYHAAKIREIWKIADGD
ncbi:D-glutamate cyclase, mitochondrial-like isoform X2 [Corticium candelabrum]|nr:D-glutamate cyclase, mitochondrial-like isoform X2 [Corticium candelabrum]XP_062505162.1 D-glutamate cyclase, mitochondrial-like isoform X2 [Corticium candelabrum]